MTLTLNQSRSNKTVSFTADQIKYVSPQYAAALAGKGITLAKPESAKPPMKRRAPTVANRKPENWLDRVIRDVRKDMNPPWEP